LASAHIDLVNFRPIQDRIGISVSDSKCLTREIGLIPKPVIQYVKSLRQILYRCLAPFGANGCNVCRIAMISTMRTARPTTGSPLSVFEAGTAPFDPASSCFRPFCRLDPADPFIARERRNVLPSLQRFYVGGQCPFQVRGQVMDHTARDLFFAQSFAHKCIAEFIAEVTYRCLLMADCVDLVGGLASQTPTAE
jgi:hypothetical protein